MKRNATALRAFTHADDSFAADQVILGMDAGQFADWSAPGADLVREATPAEVAKANGEAHPPKAKAATAKTTKKVPSPANPKVETVVAAPTPDTPAQSAVIPTA